MRPMSPGGVPILRSSRAVRSCRTRAIRPASATCSSPAGRRRCCGPGLLLDDVLPEPQPGDALVIAQQGEQVVVSQRTYPQARPPPPDVVRPPNRQVVSTPEAAAGRCSSRARGLQLPHKLDRRTRRIWMLAADRTAATSRRSGCFTWVVLAAGPNPLQSVTRRHRHRSPRPPPLEDELLAEPGLIQNHRTGNRVRRRRRFPRRQRVLIDQGREIRNHVQFFSAPVPLRPLRFRLLELVRQVPNRKPAPHQRGPPVAP